MNEEPGGVGLNATVVIVGTALLALILYLTFSFYYFRNVCYGCCDLIADASFITGPIYAIAIVGTTVIACAIFETSKDYRRDHRKNVAHSPKRTTYRSSGLGRKSIRRAIAVEVVVVLIASGTYIYFLAPPYRPCIQPVLVGFDVSHVDRNWSVEIIGVSMVPLQLDRLSLTVVDSYWTVVSGLDKVPLTSLNEGNWSVYRAVYHPRLNHSFIYIGDVILLDYATFSEGCRFTITGDLEIQASGTLHL